MIVHCLAAMSEARGQCEWRWRLYIFIRKGPGRGTYQGQGTSDGVKTTTRDPSLSGTSYLRPSSLPSLPAGLAVRG